ncbi:hypothetical protein BASA61_006717 [Batrachochytrium salamandrivorans]|nr:hypothetical protein BASA61_006717 [Batrachochytrium salamandrivorans]
MMQQQRSSLSQSVLASLYAAPALLSARRPMAAAMISTTVHRSITTMPNLRLFAIAMINRQRTALSVPAVLPHASWPSSPVHHHQQHPPPLQQQFTYNQLLCDAAVLKTMLLHEHASSAVTDLHGRRVAFLMPRGYTYVSCLYAIWSAGGIAVPLCTSHPSTELEYTIQDSGADTVMYDPQYTEQINPIQARLPGIRWISSNEFPTKPAMNTMMLDLVDFDTSRGALLIYTSGTTGKPKGVLFTHAGLEAQVSALVSAWEWTFEDRILHVLPLHHIHGIVNVLLCALWAGATCELTADHKFNPREIWKRWMEPQQNLTLFMAVPTIFAKLAAEFETMDADDQRRARIACSQFRVMVSGSSALSQSGFTKWLEITGHRLLERYGMTEVGMALGNPLNGPRVSGEVGCPFPGVQVKIVSQDTGVDVAPMSNEPGELLIRGPQVFSEYWGRPDATRDAFAEPGHWFQTGDVACQTPLGMFKILGRASVDILKSGGYKISALDIEREMGDHDKIAEVAVVGIPDVDWGERIGAVVVLKNKSITMTIDELRSWLAPRLAPYKLPTRLVVLEEIPKNAMGKINKKELSNLFCNAK